MRVGTGILGLCLLLSACGMRVPDEAAVWEEIVGQYCSSQQTLVLQADSSYYFEMRSKGVLSETEIRESCSGQLRLIQQADESWVLSFEAADSRRRTVHSCAKQWLLWQPKIGYTQRNDSLLMPSLFDDGKLKACE